jgi:hypothetical protein
LRPGTNRHGALHLIENSGDRQTSLLGHPFSFGLDDLGIAEHSRFRSPFGNVHDNQTFMEIDLGRGESDSWGGIHGLEHVFDLHRKGGVEHFDRLCLGAKSGVRVFKNLQARHDVPLDCC